MRILLHIARQRNSRSPSPSPSPRIPADMIMQRRLRMAGPKKFIKFTPNRKYPDFLGEFGAPAPARAAMSQDDSSKQRDCSPSGDEELGDSREKPREKSKLKLKIIRVLTVLAYVLSVSLAAILLSLYYVFLWDPKMPGTGPMGRLEADPDDGAPVYAMQSAPAPSADPTLDYLSALTAGVGAVNATEDEAVVTQMLGNVDV